MGTPVSPGAAVGDVNCPASTHAAVTPPLVFHAVALATPLMVADDACTPARKLLPPTVNVPVKPPVPASTPFAVRLPGLLNAAPEVVPSAPVFAVVPTKAVFTTHGTSDPPAPDEL